MSVIIPAHNEEAVIGRLLRELCGAASAADLELIVVANGCTDQTATTAADVAAECLDMVASVRVISVPEASKFQALRVGDRHASSFPRVWVDADVVVGAEDIRRLCTALRAPGIHAAAPSRVLEMAGRPRAVQWYYEVWRRLPEVASGLFGRGVIAMTSEGHARVTALPRVMGDDLLVSLAFEPWERVIVDEAQVVIYTPRTVADLVRRRVRVVTSSSHVRQEVPIRELAASGGQRAARTRFADLFHVFRAEPQLAPKIAMFLVVGVVARWHSGRVVRRGDFTTWLRDESSRTSARQATPAGTGPWRWGRCRRALAQATTARRASRR